MQDRDGIQPHKLTWLVASEGVVMGMLLSIHSGFHVPKPEPTIDGVLRIPIHAPPAPASIRVHLLSERDETS
jgi:hypothetical protein